jgi:hypothetical protein
MVGYKHGIRIKKKNKTRAETESENLNSTIKFNLNQSHKEKQEREFNKTLSGHQSCSGGLNENKHVFPYYVLEMTNNMH